MDYAERYMHSSMLAFSAMLAALLIAACSATQAKPSATGAAQARAGSPPSLVAYPQALRGTWMPKRIGCVPPDAQGRYQGEDLLYIGADMLGKYENTSKPLRVEQIAVLPPAWTILTTFSPGTGKYAGAEAVGFVLREDELSIKTGEATAVYVRCGYSASPASETKRRSAGAEVQSAESEKPVVYPEALRGTWRLDPLRRPCLLPLSPDSDGRFVVTAHEIESYESTYTPVSVKFDPGKEKAWRIVSVENHLGTQKETVQHSFALEGDTLVEQDGEYRAVYMKCKERGR